MVSKRSIFFFCLVYVDDPFWVNLVPIGQLTVPAAALPAPHVLLSAATRLLSATCCSKQKRLCCVTGTSKHEQDEAYEEAAYLKTNRFLAAYVVDEQSRASYVNDLLNEAFQHVRVKSQTALCCSTAVGSRLGQGTTVPRAILQEP